MYGKHKRTKQKFNENQSSPSIAANNIIEETESILSNKIDQKEIIDKARKLNVSKEEVMLVSRLKKMISTNAA